MASAGTITREGSERAQAWLREKLCAYAPELRQEAMRSLARKVAGRQAEPRGTLFANPFGVEDLTVFDEETLGDVLASGVGGMSPEELGQALRGGPTELVERVAAQMAGEQQRRFIAEVWRDVPSEAAAGARRRLLDALFWELTYWKTPELYEELTEGERLHPGIFERLAPELRGRVVLDAGAGSGRATLACLGAGASRVYAVEPSPGLLRLLKQKLAREGAKTQARVRALRGRFDALPLPDDSIDVALSCSAFTSDPLEGGEMGLAELRRVTRQGGALVLIWPRPEDYAWLAGRGFAYAALSVPEEMGVRYRSRRAALEVARRFYAGNRAVVRYLQQHEEPAMPYAVLGDNPPHDYCWLVVEK